MNASFSLYVIICGKIRCLFICGNGLENSINTASFFWTIWYILRSKVKPPIVIKKILSFLKNKSLKNKLVYLPWKNKWKWKCSLKFYDQSFRICIVQLSSARLNFHIDFHFACVWLTKKYRKYCFNMATYKKKTFFVFNSGVRTGKVEIKNRKSCTCCNF